MNDIQHPEKALRIVLQVVDTEENRESMLKCLEAIKRVRFHGSQGISALKYEEINIKSMGHLTNPGDKHA
jgi:hypothetical protein